MQRSIKYDFKYILNKLYIYTYMYIGLYLILYSFCNNWEQ
jgi:hypothetical protein